jgi:hypothetical protein
MVFKQIYYIVFVHIYLLLVIWYISLFNFQRALWAINPKKIIIKRGTLAAFKIFESQAEFVTRYFI